ncbi:hypothetical protein BH695_3516 [Microcystis aeruginosa PCC 7806SL]|uniref:Uncharacterized protein n=1 Tax=Microcystis aeruginosa PCC 7806SL TaxID=1903187 RepID=A0AB33BZM8_MICA7|nr:hypothetical protein BH695_3516 [Microcystis aeruginosa PCC 7806SL]
MGILLYLGFAEKVFRGGRVWGVGCGVWGVGCGVWGVGCGVWGVGCGVWGVGRINKNNLLTPDS